MMKELPENVFVFDAIRRAKLDKYGCKCGINAKYEIDTKRMIVRCTTCDVRVEPFDALTNIVTKSSIFQQQVNELFAQRQELENYKPHRVVLKQLEQLYNKSNRGKANLGTKGYPCCPSCKEPFELEEIAEKWYTGIKIQQQLYTRQNSQHKYNADNK
ncbi:hypothetical protein [Staphylococcus aureus]|uniref:hypothetical protein n=2 Tax=Bacillales TaxID=1385 RepID=UPI001746A2DD|nr:hypothetical protein [Staphylococcus aureus]